MNLEGSKIGKLTVLEYFYIDTKVEGKKRLLWRCQCECGNICNLRTDTLTGKNKKLKTHYCCRKCSDKIRADKRRLPNYQSLKNNIYKSYEYAANYRNYEFDITIEEMISIIERNCYYCGSPPMVYIGDKSYLAEGEEYKRLGIDRKDNKKGYTINNCVSCCFKCNMAKQEMSIEDFKNWIITLYNNLIEEKWN